MKKEAMLYEKNGNGELHCYLCSHHCRLKDGEWGACGVRSSSGGKLYTSVYGETVEANVETAGRGLAYQQLKGSKSYILGAVGCNFRCGHCNYAQVSQISKSDLDKKLGFTQAPREVMHAALRNGCKSVRFDYTEPTVYFEYVYDIAGLAKKSGLKTIMATNGYMTSSAADLLKDRIDVFLVDLKSFSDEFYARACGAKLRPVLDTIGYLKSSGLWVEVSTLIIPGQNDSENELKDIAGFISDTGKDIPWHITRMEPDFKCMDSLIAPVESLLKARKLGKERGLRHVEAPRNFNPVMV